MPPKKKKSATTGEDGEALITSWDSSSKDGQFLRFLVHNGHDIAPSGKKYGAAELRSQYQRFQKYATPTLNSGLQTARKGLGVVAKDRAAAASVGCKSSFIVPLNSSVHLTHLFISFSQRSQADESRNLPYP